VAGFSRDRCQSRTRRTSRKPLSEGAHTKLSDEGYLALCNNLLFGGPEWSSIIPFTWQEIELNPALMSALFLVPDAMPRLVVHVVSDTAWRVSKIVSKNPVRYSKALSSVRFPSEAIPPRIMEIEMTEQTKECEACFGTGNEARMRSPYPIR
jgi:hypothetical protein